MLNIVVVRPMPSVSASVATMARPGDLQKGAQPIPNIAKQRLHADLEAEVGADDLRSYGAPLASVSATRNDTAGAVPAQRSVLIRSMRTARSAHAAVGSSRLSSLARW